MHGLLRAKAKRDEFLSRLLGNPPKSTLYRWQQAPNAAALPHDTLERLWHVFGIYSAPQQLLPRPEAADSRVKKPNAAALFGGTSALERMLSGRVADLYSKNMLGRKSKGGSSPLDKVKP